MRKFQHDLVPLFYLAKKSLYIEGEVFRSLHLEVLVALECFQRRRLHYILGVNLHGFLQREYDPYFYVFDQ